MSEAQGDCVEVSISEYTGVWDTAAELENTAVSPPETLAEPEVNGDVDRDTLGLDDTIAEIVKYEAVCTPELVIVGFMLIV